MHTDTGTDTGTQKSIEKHSPRAPATKTDLELEVLRLQNTLRRVESTLKRIADLNADVDYGEFKYPYALGQANGLARLALIDVEVALKEY